MNNISNTIWNMKYRFTGFDGTVYDESIEDTWSRIAKTLAEAEQPSVRKVYEQTFYEMLHDFKFLPAGRIISGAGTGRNVTLFNCFVSSRIQDSIDGIFSSLKDAAMTLQQGGGIGMDFSTIRPKGAEVVAVASEASGPLTFMDCWDTMCRTIMSAGVRRGAMMGVMRCDHPDIEEFIDAKRDKSRFRNFNLSVLVTNTFIEAVNEDKSWPLVFNGKVYKKVSAKHLWDKILRNTYEVAEPGVIFIDRVNEYNNLNYCETISCTNPCFAPGTRIVTSKGAIPVEDLVGKTVAIHDGENWVTVDNFRVTGKFKPVLKITLQDGSHLRVTENHTMILRDGSKVEAGSLKVGEHLQLHDLEYHGTIREKAAYLKGFLLGDGYLKDEKYPQLLVYNGKKVCFDRLEKSAYELEVEEVNTNAIEDIAFSAVTKEKHSMKGLTVRKSELIAWCGEYRYGLPDRVFRWDHHTKCEFLAGFFDSDGCVNDSNKGFGYQAASISKTLLLDVQELLKSIGVRSRVGMMKPAGQYPCDNGKVYPTQDCWRLSIGQEGSIKLAQQVRFARLKSFACRETKHTINPRMSEVVAIEQDGVEERVYCCTVPTTNSLCIAQGIVTGNCGELPLPPHGACLLGSINLTKFVKNPFTEDANIDYELLGIVIHNAIRMMDNSIDVSKFALPEQAEEAAAKRRIGLGVTGLADALAMMKIRYGSGTAEITTSNIMYHLKCCAYEASADLARVKGAFPLYSKDHFEKRCKNVQSLPDKIKAKIREYGLRNGHLTSIAPTGTISLFAGNVSSGIEPIFSLEMKRKILDKDGQHKEEVVKDYAWELHNQLFPNIKEVPDYFVTTDDLTVDQHLAMQGVAQEHIDTSISKTINCPEDMSFDDFKAVYMSAFNLKLKGCTTYRPNEVTGAVLTKVDKDSEKGIDKTPSKKDLPERSEVLTGKTYKLKFGVNEHAFYITINDIIEGGVKRPYEVFINSKNMDHYQWVVALTRMISAIFRRGGDLSFVSEELKAVFDPQGGSWHEGTYCKSLVAAVGTIIERHVKGDNFKEVVVNATGKPCPKCGEPSLTKQEGCEVCLSCSYSKCS